VIGGEFRSRKLKTLPGLALRPTPDRLREALFNVLAPRIEGAVFVDAYAGSGAVGIEALSRGAARAIFLEKHFAATRLIRENLRSLGIEDRASVAYGAAAPALARLEGPATPDRRAVTPRDAERKGLSRGSSDPSRPVAGPRRRLRRPPREFCYRRRDAGVQQPVDQVKRPRAVAV